MKNRKIIDFLTDECIITHAIMKAKDMNMHFFETDYFKQSAKRILEFDNYVICGHINPDADCIGSQLELKLALESIGKNVTCLLANSEKVDKTLEFLPNSSQFIPAKDFKIPDSKFCFIAVDVPTIKRLGKYIQSTIEAANYVIVVDHHEPDVLEADLKITYPKAASASLVVWKICQAANGVTITKDIAICALCGLVSDTGSFRFQNADSVAFNSAAEMVAAGADPNIISENLYQNRSIESFKLEKRMMDHMYVNKDLRYAISWLDANDFIEFKATKMDAVEMIDILRSLGCVDAVCMLRQEIIDGSINGNLRSKNKIDVSKIAKVFGGGGHKAAAGFCLDNTTLQQTIEDIKKIFQNLQSL